MKQLWDIAARILEKSSREHPADAVLCGTFKHLRVLTADETRQISDAVFSYFRCRNWCDTGRGLRADIEEALGFRLALSQKEVHVGS